MIRRPHSRLLLAAVAVLAATACEEESITLDSGEPSTLEVRAYVDVNGNGAFDSGQDQAIASATITATGPVEVSADTDGSGLAALEGLVPGSYTLSFGGSAPAGAVLASATSPVVVADFRGGSLSSEFRFAFEPGSISGRLFRDDNENGAFDPEADLPAAGIPVMAVRSGDGAERSTLTAGDGSFSFEGLRPGTWTVSFELPEDADLVGGETFTVNVQPDQGSVLQAIFTGELVIDIADARDAPLGQSVTVVGTVSWQKQWDSRNYYIQDETGGVEVFDFDRPDLAIGDRVRVTGERSEFGGEIQISPVNSLEIMGNVGAPVPATPTAAELTVEAFGGVLVSLDGTVLTVEVINQFGTQVVTLEDSEGDTFEVFADNRTGVVEQDWEVGALFGVTGVVAPGDEGQAQVNVRMEEDVQRGGATTPIADARQADGATVVVEGVLTFVHPDGRALFLQDGTAGISVFDFDLSDFEPGGGFQRGQVVRIVGVVGSFRGEVQLGSLSVVDVVADGAVPSPVAMTAAEIDAGENQGELALATGTVTNIQTFSFDNHLVTLEDAAGNPFNVSVDSRVGVASADWTVGTRYRVTGALGTDDRNTPAEQLEPRGPEDQVELAAGAPLSVAEARAMVGETVTIRGVVSRKESWDDRDGWVQDGTGGIYTSGELTGASAGDEVEITGVVGQAFGDEIEIEPTSVTVLGSPGAPAPVVVTGEQVLAGFYQGVLVQLSGSVVAVDIVNQFGTQVVTLRTADGAEVEVFSDNRTGLSESDWTIGETVTIVGPVGRFFDPQLEIMDNADVTFGS